MYVPYVYMYSCMCVCVRVLIALLGEFLRQAFALRLKHVNISSIGTLKKIHRYTSLFGYGFRGTVLGYGFRGTVLGYGFGYTVFGVRFWSTVLGYGTVQWYGRVLSIGTLPTLRKNTSFFWYIQ